MAPSQQSQVMLESGTKQPDALPAALYGCPYPPARNGDCQPPPMCNCYQVGAPRQRECAFLSSIVTAGRIIKMIAISIRP